MILMKFRTKFELVPIFQNFVPTFKAKTGTQEWRKIAGLRCAVPIVPIVPTISNSIYI